MDDSCAVCAETLEWVAYGFCGHREVCSTCVIRLRFICNDRCCCICKSESNFIFVTKALGDYTRSINDFSTFPADPTEGQVGSYWYHEGTQAYFDDLDHYKMIKAMCKLSCAVCDKMEEQRNVGPKRRGGYKGIEQLRSHLFNRHRLFMCGLCLEGRKIFICEQKLYSKGQLNQHVKTGDSEVDGSESERGGFMGHPMCEFCQNPFYGDNELYLHMSTEHYTCHICQRQHPGQYEYYKNYDDLEIHFRQLHFLCEDEACLEKKFIVFATESEMKRHNAKEHGGHMSRSKRNAALQIPISFHYRRSNEQNHRGRGRGSRPDSSDNQLSLAIQASLETANAERFHDTSSSTQAVSSCRETIDTIGGSFELLATTDSEPSSRYHQALGQNSRNSPLEESSFPPLPSSKQKSRHGSKGLGGNSMAARLRQRNNGTVTVLNSSSQAWPAASHQSNSSASGSNKTRPVSDSGRMSLSSSPSFSCGKPETVDGYLPSSSSSSTQAGPATAHGFVVSSTFASSSKGSSSSSKVNHSALAPNLLDRGSVDNSISNFPPVSAAQIKKVPTNSRPQLKVEDVQSANKALVDKIRAALEFDEDKYTAFKVISADYRQNLINTGEYLANVHQFGLAHLILELARLCPDAQKQRELVETYNFNMRSSDSGQSKNKKGSKKGKEKCQDNGINGSINASAHGIKLLPNHKLSVEEVEVLLKDGYRSEKGKSKIFVDEQTNLKSAIQLLVEPGRESRSQSSNGGSKKNLGTGSGGNKPRKKTSKFLRNRLGDTSAEALSDLGNSDPGPDQIEEKRAENKDPPEGLPVRGVWQNGGGRLLVAKTQRKPKK